MEDKTHWPRPAANVGAGPRQVGKYLAHVALVFVAYSVAHKLGQVLPAINSSGIAPVWPASGIALAAVLCFGDRVWPGVAAGALVVDLLGPFPLPLKAALVYAIGATLAPLAGHFLLRRVVRFDRSMSRLRDALGLVVFGAFGSSVVSASIGASVLYAVRVRAWSGFGKAWLIYWLGDSMGVLLLTPFILSISRLRSDHVRAHIRELLTLLLLLTASCLVVFGDLPFVGLGLHILSFAVFPFVIWAALRFGMSGTTLVTFLIASIATVETARGSGPFAENTPFINALLLDLFFAVLLLSGMTLAAVIAEWEHVESDREHLIRRQEAMGSRLRLAAIVESSNDAILARDLDGIITDWNDGAERLFGYPAVEMIGKSISVLAPPDRVHEIAEIKGKIMRADVVKSLETERLKKDGTRFDVSLTISPIIDDDGGIVGASVIAHDISERKRQEAILRESEARFRLMADSAPALIWMSETNKLCTYFNKSWLDFTGRSLDQEKGNGWAKGVHPDDIQRCLDIYTQAFDRREEFGMEYRLRRHDGEYRWIFDVGVPRFDANHSFVGYIGSCVDVTERRHAEEAVRASEERFRLASQAGRMFAYEWDAATDVVVRSGESARVLGIDEATPFTGQHSLAKVHPDDRGGLLAAMAGLSPEKPQLQVSYRMVRPDGTVIWVERNSLAHFDTQGRLLRIVGMVVDVTERKLAERELALANDRLRLAMEAVRSVGWDRDIKSGRDTLFGDLRGMLGIPAEVHDGHLEDFLRYIHPEDRTRVIEAIDGAMESRKPYAAEFRTLLPDGAVRWVGARGKFYYSREGEPERMLGMAIDVTERKLAETALRESEQRLRLAAQAGKMFAYDWDIATDVVFRSEEATRILRLADESNGATHRQVLAKTHPEDRANLVASIAALTPENPDLQFSGRFLRPDGSMIWVERTGRAFFDEQGRMVRMIGMVADVTERKRVEEALRASQEQLQAIWNNSPSIMFIKDRLGRYLDVNPLFLSLTTLPREQILGKTDEELFPPEQAAAYRTNDRRVLEENRPIEFEESAEQKDGVHTSIVQKFPLRDAQRQPYAICGNVTDITTRKRAELALRDSEERLRLAARAGSMYAFDWDVATGVVIRSEEATRILGLTGEPITYHQFSNNVHPEDRAAFTASISELSPENPNTQVCFRLLRPDGSVLWLDRTGHAFFDEHGRMTRMIGMVADVTARKLAEEALSKIGGRLIQAHEEERTWVARELHDDIAQQLALLANNLARMEQDLPNSVPEIRNRVSEQLNHVQEIALGVQAMSHRLHSSKLQLLGIVAATKSFCQELSEQQEVEIDFTNSDVPRNMPEEISLCLFRVLQEALQNAIKHSGVRHFEVELRGAPDEIYLAVRDEGHGFDTKGFMNNRGLGLVSMQERVNMVKGTISIISRPQFGTDVSVRVPLSAATLTERAKSACT